MRTEKINNRLSLFTSSEKTSFVFIANLNPDLVVFIRATLYPLLNCNSSPKMMLGGTPGEVNPNSAWLNSRGIWLTYSLAVFLLHLALLSFPFLSVAWTWTLTNVLHNTAMFIFLHLVKGTPWESSDQGSVRDLTHWEQIDNGAQFTATRKFLTVFPIILFFLTSFYTKYDSFHFVINFSSLVLVLLPKLPQFHGVRLFGINKY